VEGYSVRHPECSEACLPAGRDPGQKLISSYFSHDEKVPKDLVDQSIVSAPLLMKLYGASSVPKGPTPDATVSFAIVVLVLSHARLIDDFSLRFSFPFFPLAGWI